MNTAVKVLSATTPTKKAATPFDRIDEAIHEILARRLGWAGDRAVLGNFGRLRHALLR
ncbi:hypothetical protein ACVI1K_002445 [Bradyrhizobium sp. USDA 4508]